MHSRVGWRLEECRATTRTTPAINHNHGQDVEWLELECEAWIGEWGAMNTNISIPENRLAAFCKANGIARLALFGSVLRDDFGPDSDVDVLVEFQPERVPGLLGVAALEIALSDLFEGRKVDLRTPEDLSRYFRQEVMDAAEVQYVEG